MKYTYLYALLLFPFLLHITSFAYHHQSSYPYISGDTFRAFADHVLDFEKSFDPETVKKNDIVFVKTDCIQKFFISFHPHINHPYILLTHNSDYPCPGTYQHYLDDTKLIAWFGQNFTMQHPKLLPLPIGIANKHWKHGDTKALEYIRNTMGNVDKNISKLLHLNFSVHTNKSERLPLYAFFSKKPFCTAIKNQPFQDYLHTMSLFMFTLSPHGNGLDCHRTWEALLLGCIPIVRTSTLDDLYKNLPVLIVQEWSEITESFLKKHYEIMQKNTYDIKKLFVDYWFEKINRKKRQ